MGECMVEMAPAGDSRYAMGFAGDTFNTAWYARRVLPAEVEVAYLTGVGTDETSRRMVEFIGDAGIIPETVTIEGRTVGLYLISLKDGERSFSYWRDTSAARLLARGLGPLPRVSGPGDMAYFSGITLAILPAEDRETLIGRLAEAREAGVTVAFDPNLRPRLWSGGDEMREWVMRGAAVADIALPSFDDEAGHFGDGSPGATADRYRGAGVATVIVKNGAGTMLGVGPDGARAEVTPEPVAEVVDSTAAGDSFNAAALAALRAGGSLEEAMTAGARLAGRVVGHRGALVG
jgi:2-dehydro-3-deoxygluconokinase